MGLRVLSQDQVDNLGKAPFTLTDSVLLYGNFISLAFLGLLGFLVKFLATLLSVATEA